MTCPPATDSGHSPPDRVAIRTCCYRLRRALVLSVLTLIPAAGAFATDTECADCHDQIVEMWARLPHSALDSARLSSKPGSGTCSRCHGKAVDHLIQGGGLNTVFGFTSAEPANDRIGRCQSCHRSDHPSFDRSPHARVGMACDDCHSVHDPEARFAGLRPWPATPAPTAANRVSQSCLGCHPDVFSQFDFNERHRLREGILECTSCHDPHASARRSLRPFGKASACADCHTDKDGPFVFEHGSNRVEGCLSCHVPHGSPNRHLLEYQNISDMCYSCHAFVPGFHAGFGPENQCTNCHSTIHGSNLDAYFLR